MWDMFLTINNGLQEPGFSCGTNSSFYEVANLGKDRSGDKQWPGMTFK
jgi:hypothetical protein